MDRSKRAAETALEIEETRFFEEQGGNPGFPTWLSPSESPTTVMEVQCSDPSNHPMVRVKPSSHCPSITQSGGSESLAEGVSTQETSPDLECPICFNHYDLHRLPKVLGCCHVFCTACLKIILQKHGHARRIVCPLCQVVTPVFEGLICHISSKEDVLLGPPTHPDSQTGASLSLDALTEKEMAGNHFDPAQDGGHGVNQVAAKRLAFLLLFLMLLVAIVLLFLQPGLLKWALCIAIGCGLAAVGILCFNPRCKCSSSGLWLPSCRKGPSGIPSIS